MKLPRMQGNSPFAKIVNKAAQAVDEAVTSTIDDFTGNPSSSSDSGSSQEWSPTAAPQPPQESREEMRRRYQEMLANIPAGHVYHLLPQTDAERIIGDDASVVDNEVDEMTYTCIILNRSSSDDAVSKLTRRGSDDGEPLVGIGDVAFYFTDDDGGGDGSVDFAVGGTVYSVGVLPSADGGIAASDGVREAAIEAARTMVRNLG